MLLLLEKEAGESSPLCYSVVHWKKYDEIRGSVMGNAIDFPKNYDIYLVKALRFLQKGNLQEAESFIEKAYMLKQEKAATILYTSILAERGKYEKAKKIADEHMNLYEFKEENQLFYLTLLVKLRRFLQAESLVKKWRKEKQSSPSEKWIQMEQAIANEKEKMVEEDRKNKAAIAEKLSRLGNYSVEQQITLLQNAGELSSTLLQKITRSLLLNPYVANESKTVLIHLLIEQEAHGKFQMMWFDEIREIEPKKIGTLDQQSSFSSVHQVLEKQLSSNPSLLSMIQQEADRHFFQLYPFMDEVIVSPEEWAGYYLSMYDTQEQEDSMEKTEYSSINRQMRQWFDRLTYGMPEME